MKQDLEILSPILAEHLGEAPGFDRVFLGLRGEVVDRNRGRSVERIEGTGWTGYLKRFEGIQAKNHRKITRRTEPRVGTQAEREVRIMEALGHAGFGHPEILAWGSEVERGREQRSWLLTKELAARALDEIEPQDLDRSLLARVAGELGRTVAAGIFLPDLGLDHVYVDDEGRLFLLDFHNARTDPTPRSRELGRALIRFFKSPGAERARQALSFEEFARLYLEAAGRPEAMGRALALARSRLPGDAGGDSSWRYDEPGKAQAFAGRSHQRDEQEQALLSEVLRRPGLEGHLGRCLDAGCGTGRLQSLIESNGGQWIGLDASHGMLEQARAAGHSPLLQAGVGALPFADRAFDTVICFRLLHHLEREVQLGILTELARVCKQRLIVTAFHPRSTHEWSRAFKTRFLGVTRGRFPLAPSDLSAGLPGFTLETWLRQGALRDLYVGLWTRD